MRALGVILAVAPLQNTTTDASLDPLGVGLQSMLSTDLSAVPGLKLVERQRFSDLLAEQQLGKSGLLDQKSVAKLGKLLGATHLVSGSFSIVGERMRIDARMFEVASGRVTAAAEASGEREAFFELEKQVVQKLVGGIEVTLSPKARADVARIHTADFDAFREFSEGVALFDGKRYREAIEKLRAASARDQRFELARLTIAEYEAIVVQLRTRAQTIEQTRAEIKELELEGAAAEQAEVAKRLLAIAGKSGADQKARLTALYLLARGYGEPRPQFKELYEASDRFAMERAADRHAQRYWVEARKIWPKTSPVVAEDVDPRMPKLASFDDDFEKALFLLFRERLSRQQIATIERFPWGFDERLYVERRDAYDDYFALLRDLAVLEPKHSMLQSRMSHAARLYSDVLMLDESTAILRQLAASNDDPMRIRVYASDVERNKETAEMLARAEKGSPLREVMLLMRDRNANAGGLEPKQIEELSKVALSDAAKRTLAWARRVPWQHTKWMLLGDHPIWTLAGRDHLTTGRRSDYLRAEGELRFYAHERIQTATLILDGQPRAKPRITARIDRRIPSEFWHRDAWPKDGWNPDRSVPNAGFLVGVRDVDAKGRPMTGWLVSIGESELRLAEVRATDKLPRWSVLDGEVLATIAIAPKETRELELRVEGSRVIVKLDGKTHSLDAKAPIPTGFAGIRFTGRGYVELSQARVDGN